RRAALAPLLRGARAGRAARAARLLRRADIARIAPSAVALWLRGQGMIAAAIRDHKGEDLMASVGSDLDHTLMAERDLWKDGPPHEVFKQMRGQCPIHWT